MAIAKWIRGAPPITTNSVVVNPPPAQIITPADGKQFGFENFGNICYANSVLQALYFCSPFRELLLQSPDPSLSLPQTFPSAATAPASPLQTTPAAARRKPERKQTGELLTTTGTAHASGSLIPTSPATLFSALRSLFIHISKNPLDKGTVAPRAFIEKLKDLNLEFRNTNQQDAHEFLNFLLNKIVEEIMEDRKNQLVNPSRDDLSNSVGTLSSPTIVTATPSSNSGTSPQDATLVHKLFEGVLTSETRCLTCETVSSRDESFLDLSIDIEQNSSVTACLRQFSASEMLCQKNKFFCDSCCDLQEAEKRMKIKKLPNVLALHLKRFKYQEDVQKYIKLAYRVAFPFQLRLFNTVDDAQDPDRLYELFAIVVHIGNGPHHGHYVTIIRTPATWLIFDDETVEPIKESEISKYFGDSNSGSAYVLYYQAVDLDMGGLGLRPPTPTLSPDPVLVDKRSSLEPPVSPLLTPSLPPGLADASVSSDLGDISSPSSPTQTPFLDRSPVRSPSLQPLTVNVSAPDVAPSDFIPSPSTYPTTTTSTKNFHSLRHAPSVNAYGLAANNGATVEKRKSLREKLIPNRPATSQGLPSPQVFPSPLPEIPPILVQPPPVNNTEVEHDKSKVPGRKPSMWFKLRSGRADKRPGTAIGLPSSPQPGAEFSAPPFTSFPPSPSSPEVVNGRRRPSGSSARDFRKPPTSSVPKKSHTPKRSFDFGLTALNGTSSHRHGHESHSPGSTTSSFASSSAHAEAPMALALPSIPASPPGPAIRQPLYKSSPTLSTPPQTPIEHHRSHPQLTISKPSTSNLFPSPTRPTTSAASVATLPRARTMEPEPLPPLPTFTRPARRRASNDQSSDTTGTTGSDGRPGSIYASPDSLNANNMPPNTLPVPPKRSSRKLSLSGPILGFGKRDKEKPFAYEKVAERNAKEREKEASAKLKEREKEEKARRKQDDKRKREEEVASYPAFTVMSRI